MASIPGSEAAGGGEAAAVILPPRLDAVARLLVEGKRNKEIAAALGLSHGTVKEYVAKIFERLGVRSRTEAAVKYLSRSGTA